MKKTGEKQVKGVPNSDKNQFKPGQCGNPKGRPKGKSLKSVLNELLAEEITIVEAGNKRKMKANEAIALTLIKEALNGNIQAIKEIFDRTEGKARQSVSIEGEVKQIIWNETKTYIKASPLVAG